LEAVLDALSELADAGDAVDVSAVPATGRSGPHGGAMAPLGAGFVERVLGGDTSAPAKPTGAPPTEPGVDVDNGPEAATVQSFARPPVTVSDAPRSNDTALPSSANGSGDAGIPADQAVPATLIGLQVEPAFAWPLLRHGVDPTLPEFQRERRRERDSRQHETPADDTADEGAAAPRGAPPTERRDPAGVVFDDAVGDDWCTPLTQALRDALAARVVPQALLAAAEQWRHGRCVVLACPKGFDPAGPGWAFVLWPQPRAVASPRQSFEGRVPALALFGLRVEASLQWSSLPPAREWCHVRVVKEHHPRRGRQLIAFDTIGASATSAVPCEVQLGPVLARSLRWCEVCVRINAVRRFWSALGAQWSVNVVVCSQPLAGARAAPIEEVPC